MKLGVDVDGVQYDFVADSHDCLTQIRPSNSDIASRWNYFEDWGYTLQEFLDECAKAVDAGIMFNNSPANPEWVDVLGKLRAKGHTIHLLTDRSFGSRSMANTEKWLQANKVPYDTITFTADKTIMDVDVILDDKPQNIMAVLRARSARWVGIYDQLWNAPDCPVDWEDPNMNWSTIERNRRVKRITGPYGFIDWVNELNR